MRLIFLGVSTLALLPLSPAAAQSSSDALDRLRAADTNHDGVITRAELLTYRTANFASVDLNRDGYLSRDDVPSFLRTQSRMQRINELLVQFDRDRDGRVSRAEFTNGPTPAFDMADRNHDGQVSQAELDAARAAANAQRPSGSR